MTKKEKYDLSSVINSLGKIAFSNELSAETKQQIEANIAILEKIVEDK